ncbi:hypothetical protein D3C86_2260710 [compost metagenome]
MALPVNYFGILDCLLVGFGAIDNFILDDDQVVLCIQAVFPIALAILFAPGGGD